MEKILSHLVIVHGYGFTFNGYFKDRQTFGGLANGEEKSKQSKNHVGGVIYMGLN